MSVAAAFGTLTLAVPMNALAQNEANRVEEVRTLLPAEWGVPHPAGLAFSDDFYQLYLINRSAEERNGASGTSTIVVLSPFEDLMGSSSLEWEVSNPLNIAYDDVGERLFLLEKEPSQLIQVQVDVRGIPNPATLLRFDIGRIGAVDVQGMAVDSAREQLYLLDAAEPRIIRLEIDGEINLEESSFSVHAPAEFEASALRGMAVHPASHHLYSVSPAEALLHEFSPTGQLVASYDLSNLELTDPRGLVFGLSTDLTDRPETIHLFIADAGPSVENLNKTENPCVALIKRLVASFSGFMHLSTVSPDDAANVKRGNRGQVNGKIVEVVLDPMRCNCSSLGETTSSTMQASALSTSPNADTVPE